MSEVHALSLEPGDIVGGYTLVSRLGAGAMGSVWRVVDGGGTAYAMKILRDSLDDDENVDPETRRARTTARERLRREAMALKRINDPGVCAIVDMEIDDAVAFIVTELIEGKNLRDDVRANGKYTGDDLERLSSKLVDAVRAVHAAGIVHRDIKPTNVMISVTGPVLVDFGIAMGEGESHVTSTGLVMGTPGFIAPEIIEGTEANEATDWWSTASVLAFAATGEPVFGTSPMMAVLQREASGNANLQGLPPHTMAAFRSALSPDPAARATPEQLLDAIRQDAWQEGMPPFDGAARAAAATAADGAAVARRKYEDVDNPRRLWRAQSMPTTMISFDPSKLRGTPPPHPPTATKVMPTNAVPRTASSTVPTADTSAPATTDDEGTQTMALGPADQPTRAVAAPAFAADDDTDGPATQRIATGAQPVVARKPLIVAPAALPEDEDDEDDEDDSYATRVVPPSAQTTQALPLSETAVMPREAQSSGEETQWMPPTADGAPSFAPDGQDQSNYQQPVEQPTQAPVGAQRHRLLARRGRLCAGLCTLPLGLLAAARPLVALVVAAMLLWLLTAIGVNARAQLDRLARKNAGPGFGDHVMRVVSFPWHLVRALAGALPRALLM
ncbi:MAG: serine/threonine-protein kinase, partial [Bifidobacterium sp.]|nr:serine/threonine-protein kinase [Bifidobacterium sp.]